MLASSHVRYVPNGKMGERRLSRLEMPSVLRQGRCVEEVRVVVEVGGG